ncbi:hypothetical protein PACTADRAFT_51816 [Pachysolen tannophilus NRRL Y-2460]|uniref:Uncharacterized protein n=1 Tax=Pachysolen tannophilus NRRL Y-2460 TaxID=669874 RepID=A0A1E4TN95_PACTA|nr:hypothetical protein PACTADRAFT_51816 [Pachysolen tannophilus NRRL Y-2460]
MKSLEADIITYDNLYYLIFYEMKLLKIIIDMFIDKKIKLDKSTKIKLVSHGNKRSQKENDKVNPNDSSIYQKIKNYKKRLLSFLLVLNDYELLTLYHEISWDKFMVDDW